MSNKIERDDKSEHGRVYKIPCADGTIAEYPSVTTVLSILGKPWLVAWAAKMACEHMQRILPVDTPISKEQMDQTITAAKNQHKWIKEEAGVLGTVAHNLIEQHLKDGEPPDLDAIENLDPRVRLGVEKHTAWWEQAGFSVIALEKTVYSHKFRYAGTADCIAASPDGDMVLLDWKTSNYMSADYALQAVAYKSAYGEMTGIALGDIYIVRVGKDDADIEIWHIPEEHHIYLMQVFVAVHFVFDWHIDKALAPPKRVKPKKEKAPPEVNGSATVPVPDPKTLLNAKRREKLLARPVC